MDLLEVSNEIKEALKKEELVGQQIGSGFCFLDNSRDVQFEYSSDIVKDYFSKIEKIINGFIAKYKDYEVILKFRNDNFSFYIKPKEKESAPKECIENSAVDGIDTESYKRGWKDCIKEMMEKFKSLEDDITNM